MASARGDEAGQFRMGGLVPGDYHVIAVRSLDPAAKKNEVDLNNVLKVMLEITELR